MLILALLLQSAALPAAGPAAPADLRFETCIDRALEAPLEGVGEAERWVADGGGFVAQACRGFALAQAGRFGPARDAFALAARLAENARDPRAGRYAAQGGNAALAGGDAGAALALFDRAARLSANDAGDYPAESRGAIALDRARALVALGREAEARAAFPAILDLTPRDPLAWLLSATLARRMGDVALARAHLAEARRRAPTDPAILLEGGNIAITADDEGAARGAWQAVVSDHPGTDAAATAARQLAALDGGLLGE